MYPGWISWLLFFLPPAYVLGQPGSGTTGGHDTLATLPLVEVSESSLREEAAGIRAVRWDSSGLRAFATRDLDDLLAREGGLFIKSYGSGSLATSSIRGGSAGHTSVLWNGLPLQSPMLGLTDLSLLPLYAIDEVDLIYGGQSSSWGSGAIGGVIALNNHVGPKKETEFEAQAFAGSFGQFGGFLKGSYGRGPLTGETRLHVRVAENDFPYHTRPDLPETRQSHARRKDAGFLQSLVWRPGPGAWLRLQIWGQQAERQIPPTTVQNSSQATQEDAFLRSALQARWAWRKVVWNLRSGLFRESIDFRDPLQGVESLSRYWLSQTEVTADWQPLRTIRAHAGLNFQWTEAETGGFSGFKQQRRLAGFLMAKWTSDTWSVQGNVRQEMIDGKMGPFLPALGVEGNLRPWLGLSFRISRNFRLPTLNDLYWVPGGDPDLKPESGWSMETGLRAKAKGERDVLQYSVTAFSRLIDNWMLWSQMPGQSYYSVSNITRVWSRGLEQRLIWEVELGAWELLCEAGYDLVLSTNQVELERPEMHAGEQLAYTPRHLAFGRLGLKWRTLEASYRHQVTGKVETLSRSDLAGYDLGFARLAWNLSSGRGSYRLFLDIDNIWNANYRVLEYRPMPGVSGRLGFALRWTKG